MKKNVLKKTVPVIALSAMLFCLSGCGNEMFTSLPRKVTVEDKPVTVPTETAASVSSASVISPAPEITSTPTPTPSPTATPTPTDAPIQNAALQPVSVAEGDSSNTKLTKKKQEEVIQAANHLLDTGFYSRDSLILDLILAGYTEEEATYGADHCYITWE